MYRIEPVSNRLTRTRFAGVLLAAAAFAMACNADQIREFRVPKEHPAIAPQSMPAGHPATGGEIQLPPIPKISWGKLPDGWSEKTAGQMRAASFAVAQDGQTADVSVIPLPATGSELQLVNMWREQMALKPVSEADAPSLAADTAVGAGQGKLYDMASEQPLIGGKDRARILVAMFSREGTTWFFKMTGEEKFVAAQKNNFTGFLKGVSFPDNNVIAAAAASPAIPETPAAAPGLPQWKTPDNWKPQPAGQMLLASFDIPGAGKTTLTVSSFPGDVGGALANVNRWRRQLGLGAVAENDLGGLISSVETGGGPASLVDMTGADARLLGAMLPRDGQTWFFKMMGDPAVVAKEKDNFAAFLKSLKF